MPLLRLRSDEQLVSLFRAGNDEAFRVLHDRYRARLLAYTRQMLSASSADAEDAVQEIFVRAYAGLRNSDRDLALRAWLYRIAHNRCIDDLRRPSAIATEAIEELGEAPGPDPHDRVEQRDALRRLIADVRRLPEHQRSALLMRELGGVTYMDVAGALGVSLPAVKSLLVRARIGLAQAVEARDTACAQIREDVVMSLDRGVRTSGLARRHMRDCPGCREFRTEVRGTSRRLGALVPALGPAAAIAKLLGGISLGGGAGGGSTVVTGSGAAAGGTGAAGTGGAALGTSAAVSTGAAVGSGAAAGGGAVAGGGLLTGAASALAGAGHVATIIAAAAVTAGGAIGLQQIAPAEHHAASHRSIIRDVTDTGTSSPTASAAIQTPTGTAPVAPAATAPPISTALQRAGRAPRSLGHHLSAPEVPPAGRQATNSTSDLPITETQDPDNMLNPPVTGSTVPVGASTTTTPETTTTPGTTATTTPTTTTPGSAAAGTPPATPVTTAPGTTTAPVTAPTTTDPSTPTSTTGSTTTSPSTVPVTSIPVSQTSLTGTPVPPGKGLIGSTEVPASSGSPTHLKQRARSAERAGAAAVYSSR